MAGVAENGLILHDFEPILVDDVFVAGDGDENVALFGSFHDRHDDKTVHQRFGGFDRIDLGDDDFRAHAFGAHGHALAAPAVADDHDGLGGDDEVGVVHDGFHDRLAGAVAIVEEMLHHRVVDSDHRRAQIAVGFHRFETDDAGGRFFTAAEDFLNEGWMIAVEHGGEIAAVVDEEIWLKFGELFNVEIVFFLGRAVFGEGCDAILHKRSDDVVLCRQRIGTGDSDFCAASLDDERHVGGFRFEVETDDDFFAGEWFCFAVFFFNFV